MYNVVHKTLVGNSKGCFTWTSFKSKEDYNKWNTDKMRSWYETVAEGVTEEHAIELCTTPEATEATLVSGLRELGDIARRLAKD